MVDDVPATRLEAIERMTAPGETYELKTIEIRGQPQRTFVGAPETLRELYVEDLSSEEFFVYEDERYSFDDTWNRAAALGVALVRDYGVEPGDRVAISMRNYPEWAIAFMATTSIGAVAVAMNALWEPEEMEYGLDDCGARVIVADQERIDRLMQCDAGSSLPIVAVRTTKDLPALATPIQLLFDRGGSMPLVEIGPDADATILYTSGSTGHPKGVVSTHRNIISALLSWELDAAANALVNQTPTVELPYQAAALLGVPLFHVAGLHAVLLSSFRAQRRVVAMYKWDVTRAAELVESEKVSTFLAPAAMTGDLVSEAKRSNRDLSSLLVVGGGGAPRAPEQVKGIHETFGNAQPSTGWGMTETNAIGTGVSGKDYLDRPDSSGRAAAVLDFAIETEAGIKAEPRVPGELLVRGSSVFRGYWNRPDANEEAFTDGWFRTGDVAWFDEDGFVYIVDRIKQLIIRGGENIGCGEVEHACAKHPAVIEASAYGIPDERLGEEVGVTLYVRKPLDESALGSFLLEHLARFKIPRYCRFVAEPLPRIASGKIDKKDLKKQHVAALGLE